MYNKFDEFNAVHLIVFTKTYKYMLLCQAYHFILCQHTKRFVLYRASCTCMPYTINTNDFKMV